MPGVSKKVNFKLKYFLVSGKTNFDINTITNIFYSKNISLPINIYTNDITATSKDGIFKVTIPKKNENIDIVVN